MLSFISPLELLASIHNNTEEGESKKERGGANVRERWNIKLEIRQL